MSRTRRIIPIVPRPDPATWALRVRAARRRLGVSQAHFAWEFGVSCSAVEKWEQGERCPRTRMYVTRLAQMELKAFARERRARKGAQNDAE